jgi:DNA-binding GntR family transcriptional regulator
MIENIKEPGVLMREGVRESLRKDILKCFLPPGLELREQELATRFGVSKSPVRDALQSLEREGLVTVVPRKGYRVAPISLTDAKEMFELRVVLETACVGEAARRGDPEMLARLNSFRCFDGGDDSVAFIRYNNAFHSTLAECSGNTRMAENVRTLIEHMDRLTYLSVSVIKDRNAQQLVKEHAAIIDAVQAGDVRRARSLSRRHTLAAQKRVIGALEWNMVNP